MSIQYRAVLDRPSTTSLDVMVDKYVVFDPVHHTHSYKDIPEFELIYNATGSNDVNDSFVSDVLIASPHHQFKRIGNWGDTHHWFKRYQ